MPKIIISCLAIVLTFSTSCSSYARTSNQTLELMELFGDVFDKVRRDYVEDVEDKELVESAINGMLSSLDPHSSYLNEQSFDEMRIQTRGEFGGLGIEVTMENGLVKVVSPIDDTPASRAGLQSGDYISRIDNEAVMGTTLSEAVDKMRGKPGTDINLEVLREGESEPMKFTVTRAIIKIKSVRANIEGNDIGYVRVTTFSEKTTLNLKREINQIKNKLGGNLKGIVLDLRNNPGGLLDQAVDVSDLFLNSGEIVSTKGKIRNSNKRFNARRGDILNNKPIVVLINGGSASASEIVAGALQDHGRAIIVGSKSFGKGSVQTVIPLSKSNGAMRLTTSRYFTPSGRSIQAEGIDPDIIVTQAKIENIQSKNTPSEASLRKHLENEKLKNEEKESGNTNIIAQDKLYKTDYQLARAIDLLRGIYLFGVKNK